MRFFLIIYFVMIFFMAFLSSCEKEKIMVDPMNWTVGENEEIIISNGAGGSGNELLIQVLEINDSRCPKDAVCIWYGYASVTFQVIGGDTYRLCIGQCDQQFNITDEVIINTTKGKYTVILKEVIPYPEIGESKKKFAKFIIKN